VAFFALNIVVATMFLRWHYVIDVIAGLLLAVFSHTLAVRLSEREHTRREALGLGPDWPNCVQIALDDFGTGYSSLSYLRSFPFDRIKIDRSFVKDIAEGAGSLNIVRAVTAMAAGFGMATTAEGVETKEQLERVRKEGCTEMQGYFFSPPRPIKDIERLLQAETVATAAADAA
jgi:predicted signal transduction protein with EAL and GGDEF domain